MGSAIATLLLPAVVALIEKIAPGLGDLIAAYIAELIAQVEASTPDPQAAGQPYSIAQLAYAIVTGIEDAEGLGATNEEKFGDAVAQLMGSYDGMTAGVAGTTIKAAVIKMNKDRGKGTAP